MLALRPSDKRFVCIEMERKRGRCIQRVRVPIEYLTLAFSPSRYQQSIYRSVGGRETVVADSCQWRTSLFMRWSDDCEGRKEGPHVLDKLAALIGEMRFRATTTTTPIFSETRPTMPQNKTGAFLHGNVENLKLRGLLTAKEQWP